MTTQDTTHLHGTMLSVNGIGVLLRGKPGIGKSDIALALLERGEHLIADDHVILTQQQPQIIACCDAVNRGFLHSRQFGFINVIKLYGPRAIKQESALHLIINLTTDTNHNSGFNTEAVLSQPIHTMTINSNSTQDAVNAILVASKLLLLKLNGHDANEEFSAHQQQFIDTANGGASLC